MQANPGTELRFDLRAQIERERKYRRFQTTFVYAVLCFFLALGLIAITWVYLFPLPNGRPVLLGSGIALVGFAFLMLVVWKYSDRYAVEAVVDPNGVTWIPSSGRSTRTDWSNPKLQLFLLDYRGNRLRTPALGGPDDIVAGGPGLFAKRPSAACYDAIRQSAGAKGLKIDESIRSPGTKYEAKYVVISHAG